MAKQWQVSRKYWTKGKGRWSETGASKSVKFTGTYNKCLAHGREILGQWDQFAAGTIAGTIRTPKTVARVYNEGRVLTAVYIEVEPC